MGSESDKKSKVEVAPKPEATKEQTVGSDKGKQASSEKPSPGAERFKGEGAPKPEATKEQAFGNERTAKNSSEKPSSGAERMKSDRVSDSAKMSARDSAEQIKDKAALDVRNTELQSINKEIAKLQGESKQLQAEKKEIQYNRETSYILRNNFQKEFDKLSPSEKQHAASDSPDHIQEDGTVMAGQNRERQIDHDLKEASTKLARLEGDKGKLEHECRGLESKIRIRDRAERGEKP